MERLRTLQRVKHLCEHHARQTSHKLEQVRENRVKTDDQIQALGTHHRSIQSQWRACRGLSVKALRNASQIREALEAKIQGELSDLHATKATLTQLNLELSHVLGAQKKQREKIDSRIAEVIQKETIRVEDRAMEELAPLALLTERSPVEGMGALRILPARVEERPLEISSRERPVTSGSVDHDTRVRANRDHSTAVALQSLSQEKVTVQFNCASGHSVAVAVMQGSSHLRVHLESSDTATTASLLEHRETLEQRVQRLGVSRVVLDVDEGTEP